MITSFMTLFLFCFSKYQRDPLDPGIGVWRGVSKRTSKVLPGPAMPYPSMPHTLICPASGLPLKWLYSCFRSCLPTRRAACGRLLPLRIPHAISLCIEIMNQKCAEEAHSEVRTESIQSRDVFHGGSSKVSLGPAIPYYLAPCG
jgi:hypothetical protein